MKMEGVDIKNIIVIGIIEGTKSKRGQFLFVKETDGAIRFPGGKIKAGETLWEAMHREIREETGLNGINRGLACIEQASIWEGGIPMAAKSLLLYFFDVTIARQSPSHSRNLLWMDRKQIDELKVAVPYDNLLIARGLVNLELQHPYVIPPGFQDTPGDRYQVAVRTFCWASQGIQESRPAINA